jgi:hypothetical protein
MTGDDRDGSGSSRQARIETDHGDHETARRLARALRPDNTAEMDTRVEGARLVTTIDRERTGSLQSTADDYVVNLQTGTQVLATDEEHGDAVRSHNHNTDSSGETTDRNTSETETRSADTSDTTQTETDNE